MPSSRGSISGSAATAVSSASLSMRSGACERLQTRDSHVAPCADRHERELHLALDDLTSDDHLAGAVHVPSAALYIGSMVDRRRRVGGDLLDEPIDPGLARPAWPRHRPGGASPAARLSPRSSDGDPPSAARPCDPHPTRMWQDDRAGHRSPTSIRRVIGVSPRCDERRTRGSREAARRASGRTLDRWAVEPVLVRGVSRRTVSGSTERSCAWPTGRMQRWASRRGSRRAEEPITAGVPVLALVLAVGRSPHSVADSEVDHSPPAVVTGPRGLGHRRGDFDDSSRVRWPGWRGDAPSDSVRCSRPCAGSEPTGPAIPRRRGAARRRPRGRRP